MSKSQYGALFLTTSLVSFLLITPVFAQVAPTAVPFSRTLWRGVSGAEVSRLQEFLKNPPAGGPEIYPEGIVSGYFGALTEKAVKRFQVKYDIEPVGIVGPKTRAKLNSLALTGAQASPLPGQPPTTFTPKSMGAQRTANSLSEQFVALEKELLGAKTSGSYFSPAHYDRVKSDLDTLQKDGYPTAEIERLRKLAVSLTPHLADQTQNQPTSSSASPPSASTLSGEPPCVSSVKPQLTADITDFPLIQKITAPGSPSSEGPKGHSFIWTGGERVPVYAPVPAVLEAGSYSADTAYSPAQYLLIFQVKGFCDFQLKFDHIDEPVAAIKAVLPTTSKIADSRTTPAVSKIEFQAGDLIAYTYGTRQAGNWDFGLYNVKEEGVLAQYGSYGFHRHSVCWVDFYAPEKQGQYRRLLEGPKLVCSF